MDKSIFIFIFIVICQVIYPQEIQERTEEILHSAFKEKVNFEMFKYNIPSEVKIKIEKQAGQKFFSDQVYIYKIYNEKILKAYAILDNVYGKSMPITFVVIFDTSGNISTSEIVKYREQYGGGVSNKSWQKQFSGKNSKSEFIIGKDIDSISGATISANSITKGIRKLALLMQETRNKI